MGNKLGELLLNLEKLKKQRHKYKKNEEYHKRQIEKAIDSKDEPDKYATNVIKNQYYERKISALDSQIGSIEAEILLEQNNQKEAAYTEIRREFDLFMLAKLKDLLANLDAILKDEAFDNNASREVYVAYNSKYGNIRKPDRWIYENFRMSSLETRYGLIVEWLVVANKKSDPVRAGVKSDKVDMLAGLLKRQTLSLIEEIEKRSLVKTGSKFSKLKRVLNGN